MKNPLQALLLATGLLLGPLQQALHAQASTNIADINTQNPPASTLPSSMVKATLNGQEVMLIAVEDNASGSELWISDGSVGGSRLLIDIVPGTQSSNPTNLTVVGNRVFFSALNAQNNRCLWVTDGTSQGTVLLQTFNGGDDALANFVAFNGKLIFRGLDSAAGRELWESDGTVAGTRRNKDITENALGSALDHFYADGSRLYFTAVDGLVKIGETTDDPPQDIKIPTGRELWQMDANFEASLVMDLVPGSIGAFRSTPAYITRMGDFIYFAAQNPDNGQEVWRSDLTLAGTAQVANIAPGSASSEPSELVRMNVGGTDYLFFAATNPGAEGRELYRTDGTLEAGGTVRIKDINPNSANANPYELTVVGNKLFFGATDASGTELHFITGVPTSGNTRVADIFSGAGSSVPTNLTAFGTKLIFTATNASGITNLYFSDSTLATPTAVLLRELGSGAVVSGMTALGSNLYFLVNGTQLWKTDGVNANGTTVVIDFAGGSAGSGSKDYTLAEDGFLYFSANDGQTGREVWKTDGTTTSLVADIRLSEPVVPIGSEPADFTPCAGKVFFTADESGQNRELWVTDGTSAGTRVVFASNNQEINPSVGSNRGSNPTHLTAINGILYFVASNGLNNPEPWRSDGTPAGTYMINDLVETGGSGSRDFTLFKNQIYFVGSAGSTGSRLRNLANPMVAIVDGTSNAPSEITTGPDTPQDIVIFGSGANQRMMFSAGIPNKGRELWRSDGVSSRTEVFDINPGGAGSNPAFLTVAGNGVFFVANDGKGAGRELWRSTGSLLGTKMVKDLRVGELGAEPEDLIEAGGKLFFTANYYVKVAGEEVNMGRELWVSDGTPAGTKLVKEIVVGPGSPGITNMRSINGLLVFSADDGVNGREVWTSDGTEIGTAMLENLGPGAISSNPSDFIAYNGNLIYTATEGAVGAEPRKVFVGSRLALSYAVPDEEEISIPNEGTFNFPTVAFRSSTTLVLTIKNEGNSALTSIKPLLSGVNAKEFALVTPRPLVSIASGASTTMGIKFTPKEGGPRRATLSIISNDFNANPFTVELVGNGDKDPTITQHPVSLMLNVGEAAEFEAAASGSGSLALQWKKGAGNIAGATQNEFSIPSVVLKDGAAYSLFVKGNPLTALSNPAELGVVEDYSPPLVLVAAAGKAATFKVNATGNKLTYRWRKNGEELADDATKISGSGTKAMTVKLLNGDDTALYSCRVSNEGGSRIGGSTQLNVYTQSPLVIDDQDMPNGVVGGLYSHQVKINTDPARAALTYSAKGLPPGLKINAKTGEISGRPTKASPSGQPYQVVITAKNTINPQDPADIVTPAQPVEIAEFPAGVEGIYAGTVDHNGEINGHLGGRLDLTITKTGAFSGSLMLGSSRLALKGAINVYRSEDPTLPHFELVLKRTGKPLPEPVTLTVELNPATGLLTANSRITTSGDSATVTGWRRVDATAAADYMGFYTFGLDLGDDAQKAPAFVDKIPQGWGYASFTVAKDGKLSFVGSTADGEKITGASFVGVGGRVVMYQTMYVPLKGSLVGALVIEAASAADVSDNTLTGDVEWARPADPKSKTRMYTAGFGMPETPVEDPVPLEAAGSFYAKPIGTALLFDLAAPTELDVNFTQGGLSDASRVNATVTLNAGHKVTQDATPPEGNTKLTSIVGATGLFKGDFSLSDPDPLGGTKPIARKVPYQGLWIKDAGVVKGVGYFRLPQLPQNGQTATTSPIFGGRVEVVPEGLPQ